MGAAGLIEIKRRITSVESTRKITKAMGLVATSKLRRVRKELIDNETYSNLSKEIFKKVIKGLPYDYKSIYLSGNDKGDKLYIVLTSDMGLCGGYNNNVISHLKENLKGHENSKIIIVGSKGTAYLNRYKLVPTNQYIDIPDIPTIKEVKNIYNDVLFMYRNGEISEVNIVYAEFISPVKQEVRLNKLLPLTLDVDDRSQCIIEPDFENVLATSMDIYLKSQLRTCLLHSKASEQSARMTAMDSATENADDILQNLKIKFNRIRQGIITQEISEIVGGAEAQK